VSIDRAKAKRDTNRVARWLHVYTSMIALLLVLFFGLTGITLNHPSWTFGASPTVSTQTGSLPFAVIKDGRVDFLSIAEFARSQYSVKGALANYEATTTDGVMAFKKPGYSADLLFKTDGTYALNVEQQGFVAVMNDLHKGRDATSSWAWVIDVAAVFLVFIALTGLVMQMFLRKRRRSAFTTAGVGCVITVVLIWFTLR
jgi:uncharacterized protein